MSDKTFEIISILFWTVFIMSVVFTMLRMRMYKILEKEHLKKYEEMGKPTVFLRSSISTIFLLIKFLWKREYIELNDKDLTSLGNLMLVLFVIQSIGLFIIFIIMFNHMP